MHRVILPPNEEESIVGRRQSIAFFCNINGDAIVEPIETFRAESDIAGKYPPITAKEYLMSKHLASMAVDSITDGIAHDDEL
jgi:isopenicillin N synthase-like dioxygenase